MNAWPIPKLFTDIQRKAGLSQEEIFETLNMGIGFMCVVRKQQQPLFEKTIRTLNITCYKIGEVIKGKKAELISG
jgi:phosphoribosylformylglycinamidine cyclo-ligase